jgi:hypothetical protein
MKRIHEFIAKANQVLLFLGLLGVAGVIIYNLFDDPYRRYGPPSVKIATTPEEQERVNVDDVGYLGTFSDFHVFGVMKRGVMPPEHGIRLEQTRETVWAFPDGRAEDPIGVVNVVFTKDGKKIRTLLDQDGLLLSHDIPSQYRQEFDWFMTFVCVTEDTDGDSRLDSDDRQDLIVVTRDPNQLNIVVKGVVDHKAVSGSRIVVKIADESRPRFLEIDTESRSISEIEWR